MFSVEGRHVECWRPACCRETVWIWDSFQWCILWIWRQWVSAAPICFCLRSDRFGELDAGAPLRMSDTLTPLQPACIPSTPSRCRVHARYNVHFANNRARGRFSLSWDVFGKNNVHFDFACAIIGEAGHVTLTNRGITFTALQGDPFPGSNETVCSSECVSVACNSAAEVFWHGFNYLFIFKAGGGLATRIHKLIYFTSEIIKQ